MLQQQQQQQQIHCTLPRHSDQVRCIRQAGKPNPHANTNADGILLPSMLRLFMTMRLLTMKSRMVIPGTGEAAVRHQQMPRLLPLLLNAAATATAAAAAAAAAAAFVAAHWKSESQFLTAVQDEGKMCVDVGGRQCL
jgi:hypothetical protein